MGAAGAGGADIGWFAAGAGVPACVEDGNGAADCCIPFLRNCYETNE
jgi:hypothetical protein